MQPNRKTNVRPSTFIQYNIDSLSTCYTLSLHFQLVYKGFKKSLPKYIYYLSATLNWLNPDNEKQPMIDRIRRFTFGQKSSLVESLILLFLFCLKLRKNFFGHSRKLKDYDSSSRTFRALEIFPHFQDFPGF